MPARKEAVELFALYRLALRLFDVDANVDPEARTTLLLTLGAAGEYLQACATFDRAAARQCADAGARRAGIRGAVWRPGVADERAAPLLRDAVERLGGDAPAALKAQATSALTTC